MERVHVPANPGRLINAIANIGYDPEVALCDLIDNCIDASASNVQVDLVRHAAGDGASDSIAEYRIADNGVGMDRDALISAFTLGSTREYAPHSLGKFGLGMKSAGLSVGNEIAILTKKRSMPDPVCAILADSGLARWTSIFVPSSQAGTGRGPATQVTGTISASAFKSGRQTGPISL